MSSTATKPPHPNVVLAAEIALLAREQLGWPPGPGDAIDHRGH